jgi:AAA family ATPase
VAEYVFSGLTINNIDGQGPKRSFVVESVNGRKDNVAKCCASTEVRWFDENATPELSGPAGKLEVPFVPGMDAPLAELNLFLSIFGVQYHPKDFLPESCGIVIQGGSGTGKSMLLDLIADTRWGKVIRINSTDKSAVIRDHFRNAVDRQKPCIILIDDIKMLVGKDGSNILAIESIMNGLKELASLTRVQRKRPNVLVVATCCNYLEDIPKPLQTLTTFDSYIILPVPDVTARKEIIRFYEPNFPQEEFEQYISNLGEKTHAYTGKDLRKLLHRAFMNSLRRTGNVLGGHHVVWEDVQRALKEVPPTAMHDITLRPPTVRWDDIGGYQEVKDMLQRAFKRPNGSGPGFKPPKGVLLYGPPGCSKTMTAQAMATESGFNFFAVKGGELLNMYVGETERSIRQLFQRAREAQPSIIFFDEIDSIAGSRAPGGGMSAGGGVQALTTLLTEMDGFEEIGDIFVLAATNRPDALDPAMMRPGRFDELIYVPLPDAPAREAILTYKAAELAFPAGIDIAELATRTDGYSGAEIARICDKVFTPPLETDAQARSGQGDDPMAILDAAIRRTPKGVTNEMLTHFVTWRLSRNVLA